MAEITNLNGASVSSDKKCLLTLEYDKTNGKLQLGGQMENLDLVLNVLAQATRWAENQYQMQQQMLFAQEMQRNERLTRLVRQ